MGGKYDRFEVADYSKGFRHMRSFSDAAEARAEAKRIATQIASGEAEAAQIRGKDAAAYGQAVELLRPTGAHLLTAAVRYAECFKILGGDRMLEACKDFARRNPVTREPRTVRQVADELVELKKKRGASARYVEQMEWTLDKFAEAFARNVDAITTIEIQSWLDGMSFSPRTIKNFRDAANTLFNFAEARGYIARGDNPVAATEKAGARNGNPIEIYTPEELQRLFAAAPPYFKPILALQAFAGLRSVEITRLDWQDVKLERGHIELGAHKTKTATRRLVPILPNLAAWLADYAKQKGKVWTRASGRFYKVQMAITAATEVKADPKKKIAAVPPVKRKQNALRHSFISYRVADCNDVPRVALESGNSPGMIFAHYRELVTPADAKTWFAIAPETPANVIAMSAATK
ncbi:MAG TPA: site-specific integrase [Candidatus Sulfotelmatobacter sp.]|nr:site-specific integrase [Candidatus Sulfotelmatobacter sp.]